MKFSFYQNGWEKHNEKYLKTLNNYLKTRKSKKIQNYNGWPDLYANACNTYFIILTDPYRIPRKCHAYNYTTVVPHASYHHTNYEDLQINKQWIILWLSIIRYLLLRFIVLYYALLRRKCLKNILLIYEINVYLTWKLNYTLYVCTYYVLLYFMTVYKFQLCQVFFWHSLT